MIDGSGDSDYSPTNETLSGDNDVLETTAKIRNSLPISKETVAPLATKYNEILSIRKSKVTFILFSVLNKMDFLAR